VPYRAIAIANYFISLAKKSEDPALRQSLTPMKLQKLIYFAHGWHLALTGNPLIMEQIEAWKYGPVIPSIYHEFKACGNEPITELANIFVFGADDDILSGEMTTPMVENDPNTESFLNRIWEVYGKYTGIQLSNATHAPGTPWQATWDAKERTGWAPTFPTKSLKSILKN